MNRELELVGLSVAVTAIFGLLFSSLNVDPGHLGASVPVWESTDIAVEAPVLGAYEQDLEDVHLTRPILVNPAAHADAMSDCGTAGFNGRLVITPPVLENSQAHLEIGETGLVRPHIEMPDLQRPLPALMDIQTRLRVLRIA